MPDDNSSLTPEQRAKIGKWLDEKTGVPSRPCEMCGSNNWMLGEHIVTPLPMAGRNVQIGKSYPSVLVICGTCYNTKFFNVAALGILTSDSEG